MQGIKEELTPFMHARHHYDTVFANAIAGYPEIRRVRSTNWMATDQPWLCAAAVARASRPLAIGWEMRASWTEVMLSG